MDLELFFGRLHLLLLHLPIGLLVGMIVLEIPPFYRFNRHRYQVVAKLNWLNAVFTSFTISFGLLLKNRGTYNEELLSWHQNGGLIYGLLSWLVVFAYSKSLKKDLFLNLYRLLLGTMVVCMIVTAHNGGSLTHGRTFLTKPLGIQIQQKQVAVNSLKNTAVSKNPDSISLVSNIMDQSLDKRQTQTQNIDWIDYKMDIFPILDTKCVQCHGPSKVKGELRMDSRSNMITGGSSGKPTIVPGNPDDSELIVRIELPEDHDDFMPPDGKASATPEEIKILRKWIEQGAPWEKAQELFAGTRVGLPSDIQSAGSSYRGMSPEDKSIMDELNMKSIIVKQAPWDKSSWTVVLSHYNKPIDESTLEMLEPILERVVDLDLSDCNLTEIAWSKIANFDNTIHLHLEESNVQDKDLKKLENLTQLQSLNLFNTEITDDSIKTISRFKELKKLHLWNSAVTEQGMGVLEVKLPKTSVIR